jgi:hypothetical protein
LDIARFLMPGRDPSGFILTAIIGMVGALIGTFVGRVLWGGLRSQVGRRYFRPDPFARGLPAHNKKGKRRLRLRNLVQYWTAIYSNVAEDASTPFAAANDR